ncbi:hypothetical protein SESBI_08272 [Sesbania bispinosa]|nr:hypothetical protein SESBI_08272 [Sesbania bispinosa]
MSVTFTFSLPSWHSRNQRASRNLFSVLRRRPPPIEAASHSQPPAVPPCCRRAVADRCGNSLSPPAHPSSVFGAR